jgi:ribose transport system ATP-binding protein
LLVELQSVTKRFGRVEALRDATLQIDAAEAVGLIGDNGAGKSTLVKILSGVYGPTSGSILFDGQPVRFASPLDARQAGIEMIYQDLALCEDLDVAENVFLGREPRRGFGPFTILDRRRMHELTRQIMDGLGASIPTTRLTGDLSGGERQLVAVGRALQFAPRLLLLDEPTAALSAEKIQLLLDLVVQLKNRGVAVLLISHRFTDVLHVCDRVLVMRQGQLVGEVRSDASSVEHTMAQMHSLMTGEEIAA